MAVLIEVPALSLVAVAVLLILVVYGYKYTFGALLVTLSAALASVSVLGVHPFKWGADILDSIDNAVLATLGAGISATEWAYHKLMHYQAYAWQEIGATLAEIAEGAWRSFNTLTHSTVPRMIRDAQQFASAPLAATVARLRASEHAADVTIAHELAGAEKAAQSAERVALARIGKVERTADHAAAAAIGATLPRIGSLERDVSGLEKWVRDHAKQLTEAGMVGLVAGALSRLGLGEQQCSNNKRWTKGLCGRDPFGIDSLLTGLLVIFGTLSLIELAKELQGLVVAADHEVAHFWRADVTGAKRNPGLGDVA